MWLDDVGCEPGQKGGIKQRRLLLDHIISEGLHGALLGGPGGVVEDGEVL